MHWSSWSDEMFDIYGVSAETFIPAKDSFFNLIHPEDKDKMSRKMVKHDAGQKTNDVEFRVLTPDGKEKTILGSGESFFDEEGKLKYVIGTAQDITVRKKAEKEIQIAHQRLSSHLNNSPVGLIEWNKDFFIRKWSAQTEKIFGWNMEEVLNRHFNDLNLVFEEDGPAVAAVALELMEGKVDRNTSINRNYTKSGEMIYCKWYNSVLKDKDGNIVSIMSLIEDITELKKAEQEREKALDRYEILSKATSDTIWDWDLVNNTMFYNDGVTKMFGYEFSDSIHLADWWKTNIHPKDFIPVFKLLDEALEEQRENFQLEYRFRCNDGSYKFILDRAFAIYDGNGNPVRIIGAMQDVSYQKGEESRVGKVIIDAQERERQQIGMELHDNVKQILSASLLYLGIAGDNIDNHNKAVEMINICHNLINDSITELRRLSHQLAPATFENVSLTQVVRSLIQNMDPDKKWTVQLDLDELKSTVIADDIKVNIYRMLQEQLNNIVKYARASHLDISAKLNAEQIVLSIIDNGIGFDPTKVKMGIGLENIRRRASVFAGDLNIQSSPGNGCYLVVRLPLENNNKVLSE